MILIQNQNHIKSNEFKSKSFLKVFLKSLNQKHVYFASVYYILFEN